MLQVLCQLLGTSNLEDVQSWLVSASSLGLFSGTLVRFHGCGLRSLEKDQARTMINAALCSLKESERTSIDVPQDVDLQSLSHFVERYTSIDNDIILLSFSSQDKSTRRSTPRKSSSKIR